MTVGEAKANFNLTTYNGIYRDDGLVVFTGKIIVKGFRDWL